MKTIKEKVYKIHGYCAFNSIACATAAKCENR